ncbi:MAG: helix-turn-helix domain-containing protein [Oscillospiraceae bacterium]|nr:helix-turn-helix domain-containing protein [Oscillospiraceae bacterium]
MFYEQLQKLCKERGIKLSPLLHKLGMSASGVNRWQNGVLPNGETLIKFAEYFGVSTDCLLGMTGETTETEVKREENNIMDEAQSTESSNDEIRELKKEIENLKKNVATKDDISKILEAINAQKSDTEFSEEYPALNSKKN